MSIPPGADDPARLAAALAARDLRVAARLITRVEHGDPGLRPLLRLLRTRAGGSSRVIGLTGPPGAGKSTLADRLVAHWRGMGLTVAVLAVDPSSPFTGGAVLGDRLRLARHGEDAGVFVRSMAARGMTGGLAQATLDSLTLLDAMHWDRVLLETVGVGQNEIDISHHADCVVVLQTPMSGDVVQATKAGLMETGDVLVVNKADADGAQRTLALLGDMLGHRAGHRAEHGEADRWQPVVVSTVATTGEGVETLAASIDERLRFLDAHPGAARALRHDQVVSQALALARHALGRDLGRRLAQDPLREPLQRAMAREADPRDLAGALLREAADRMRGGIG